MSAGTAEEIRKHLRLYWGVFASLLVLTAVTVGVASFHLHIGLAILIALAVACIKGSMVAAYFMHLIGEKKIIFSVLALTFFFFGLVLILPLLTVHGSSHRGSLWTHVPVPAVDSAPEEHH